MAVAKQGPGSPGSSDSAITHGNGGSLRQSDGLDRSVRICYCYTAFGPVRPFLAGHRREKTNSFRLRADGSSEKATMSRSSQNPSTALVDPLQLREIEHLYGITDYQQIRRFLAEHAFLPPLIIEVFDDISTYFPGARCALQVVHDPDEEIPGAADIVVIYIATELDPARALDRFDALERAWWPRARARDHGKLCLNLTFT